MARYNNLIDRMDGYTVGTLVVEGDKVTLDGELPLDNALSIEVLNGDYYVAITLEECRTKMSTDGWPLFAGLYCRVRLA